MKWSTKKLEEIADLSLGKMLDQQKNKGELLPYLANVNVRWGGFELEGLRKMKFKEDEKERFGLREGDIIMCEGGEAGRCAIWNGQMQNMMYQKALHRIRPHKEVDSHFVYYSFLQLGKTDGFTPFCTGATIKHLPKEKLGKIELVFPPLPTQRKIASILSAYDDLIENNLKRIKCLQEVVNRTYEEWFVKFRINGKQLKLNEQTGLPERWKEQPMSNLVEIISGYPFKSSEYILDGLNKIVTIKNVQDGYFVPITTYTLAKIPSNVKPEQKLGTGDIIVSLTGNVGRICLVYGENYLLNQRVAKLIPINKSNKCFTYSMLRSRTMITKLENLSNGAAQQNLSPINMGHMNICMPTNDILIQFSKATEGIIEMICKLNLQNNLLKESRDILLPRLMNGEIEVD